MNKEIKEVKMIEWFDDHFYKINYVNEAKQDIVDYFPSTTTKLGALAKPFLVRWYGKLGTREAELQRDEASDKGTRLHWAWYTFITGGAVVYQPIKSPLYSKEEMEEIYKKHNGAVVVFNNQEDMYNMTKLQRFVEILKPSIAASEEILYDIDNREAGTVDNIFDIKGGSYEISGIKPLVLPQGRYIFDLKSGSSIGKEANMQVADYAKMAEKSGYGKIKGTLIGHTQGKSKYGIEGFTLLYQDEEKIEQEYQDYRDIAKVWDRNFGTQKPVIRQIPGIITLK